MKMPIMRFEDYVYSKQSEKWRQHRHPPKTSDVENDLKTSCHSLDENIETIRSARRLRQLSDKRTACIYALFRTGRYTITSIAKAVHRHHSTAISALKRIRVWLSNSTYSEQINYVKKACNSLNIKM